MSLFKKIFTSSLLAIIFLSLFTRADAALVYIEKPAGVVQAGDTVIVKVLLDTEGEEINTLEGVVDVRGDVSIDSIQTGSSIFSLWTLFPVAKNQQISFTGGTPSSAFGGKLQVFTFAITPRTTGTVSFDVSQAVAYRADGQGTRIKASSQKTMTLPVVVKLADTRNELSEILKSDVTSPRKFTVEYARDPSLYNGKVFLSFNTTDAGSGIMQYEVVEEGKSSVVVGNTYVLKNQDLVGDIVVTAVDQAGNRRSEHVMFGTQKASLYGSIVILVMLLLCALVLSRWFKRKRDEKIQ
ncbi:MAG: hypothetical protein NTV02_02630 [Candidatus Zambryskibacteria bacterium]|nr:hypothetical protein [Candidatus Zambryskibacteria bacterium]